MKFENEYTQRNVNRIEELLTKLEDTRRLVSELTRTSHGDRTPNLSIAFDLHGALNECVKEVDAKLTELYGEEARRQKEKAEKA